VSTPAEEYDRRLKRLIELGVPKEFHTEFATVETLVSDGDVGRIAPKAFYFLLSIPFLFIAWIFAVKAIQRWELAAAKDADAIFYGRDDGYGTMLLFLFVFLATLLQAIQPKFRQTKQQAIGYVGAILRAPRQVEAGWLTDTTLSQTVRYAASQSMSIVDFCDRFVNVWRVLRNWTLATLLPLVLLGLALSPPRMLTVSSASAVSRDVWTKTSVPLSKMTILETGCTHPAVGVQYNLTTPAGWIVAVANLSYAADRFVDRWAALDFLDQHVKSIPRDEFGIFSPPCLANVASRMNREKENVYHSKDIEKLMDLLRMTEQEKADARLALK
jgi:hypothetical protein